MKLRKPRRSEDAGLNIAPLIDVVFLLIIFFMLVAQITQVEVKDLKLPEAESGVPPADLPPAHLVVNVRKDGRYLMLGQDQTPESLRHVLARAAQAHGPETVSVVIRGHREAEWRAVAPVLAACAANGIRDTRVAVVEPGQS